MPPLPGVAYPNMFEYDRVTVWCGFKMANVFNFLCLVLLELLFAVAEERTDTGVSCGVVVIVFFWVSARARPPPPLMNMEDSFNIFSFCSSLKNKSGILGLM